MKNWDSLDADENRIISQNFTPGRQGRKINKIILHHNAGNLSIDGCYRVFMSNPQSAHYQVDANGRVGQLVWDCDTAWHAGDWDANLTSIGIEHANNDTSSWTISEATLDNGAHLVAALCKYFGLGRPVWGVNVFPHNHFTATACPGAIDGSQNATYMGRAQKYYDEMTGSTPAKTAPAPAKTTPSEDIDALAQAVIRGEYGNGDERRNRLGGKYDAVQARVNQILTQSPAPASTPEPDIDALAQAVIRGEYGNGTERRNRLGGKYDAVQARVNELLL